VKQHRTAVVTGGAGFIGSHLAEALLEQGWHVTIVDDLSTGRLENIAGLLPPTSHHPSVGSRQSAVNSQESTVNSRQSAVPPPDHRLSTIDFVEGSVTDLSLLQDVFRGAECVFHQAALARVPRSIEDPLTTNDVNIRGTLNVLWAAKQGGVRKVVYASSSSVYGNTLTLPQREEMPPNPLSPYALTKLAGEHYCSIFRQIYGLPTVCLRYFNVYGPRQDPESQYATAVAAFIGRLSQDLPPIIYGDGEQTRDFTFVRDVVDANILALRNGVEGVYNIGAGRNVSINQLAETIIGLMGKNFKAVHEPPRPGDPRHTLADVSKAKTFGYEPKYDLKTGLGEVIQSAVDSQ